MRFNEKVNHFESHLMSKKVLQRNNLDKIYYPNLKCFWFPFSTFYNNRNKLLLSIFIVILESLQTINTIELVAMF